jgi:hypothetical protein
MIYLRLEECKTVINRQQDNMRISNRKSRMKYTCSVSLPHNLLLSHRWMRNKISESQEKSFFWSFFFDPVMNTCWDSYCHQAYAIGRVFQSLLYPRLVNTLALSCLSVRMQQLSSHWAEFNEIWYFRIFIKPVEKISSFLKIWQE